MRLDLVAGVRAEVRDYFLRVIRQRQLERELGRSIRVLFTGTKDEYFARFNALMRETDVLWTKPSEMVFYAGLGLPLLLTKPIGVHAETYSAPRVARPRSRGMILSSAMERIPRPTMPVAGSSGISTALSGVSTIS